MSTTPLQETAQAPRGAARPGERRGFILWLVIAILLSAFALWGAARAPFHPDESTQLYMSHDFELLIRKPISMAWSPGQSGGLRAHYRLMDAPLTKYLLGLGRSLAGLQALPVDWNWSKSWAENQAAGALPDPRLLVAGRVFLTLLTPLDLLLIYRIGKRIQGEPTGLLATILFGLNALALLHDRRAMAEAALTFGTLLALWSFLEGNQRPWLAGLAVALAVNAKQTAVVLLPVGLLAVCPPLSTQEASNRSPGRLIGNWAQYGAVFLALFLLLNPFLWKYPLQAAQAAWRGRQDLLQRQIADFSQAAPDQQPLSDPTGRLAALLAHVFMTPPSFAETANYVDQTKAAEVAYLAVPGHNLLRGFLAGGVMMLLTLGGMILGLIKLRRSPPARRRGVVLLLFSTFALGAGVYWLMILPWQRYVMPLEPLVCLWTAYAIGSLWERK